MEHIPIQLYYTQWTFLLVTLYFGGKAHMTIQLKVLVAVKPMVAKKLQDFGVTCSRSCFRCCDDYRSGVLVYPVPFLARGEYDMNFLLIGTHSINVIFIIGDTALNSLCFPWFTIAYFLMWTGIFVNVQWIIHANVSICRPYPFLDSTFPRAPAWYLVVALLHFPCYALIALALRLKQSLLESWFPLSYTYVK